MQGLHRKVHVLLAASTVVSSRTVGMLVAVPPCGGLPASVSDTQLGPCRARAGEILRPYGDLSSVGRGRRNLRALFEMATGTYCRMRYIIRRPYLLIFVKKELVLAE